MKRIILLFICILLCASLAGCKLNSGSVDSSLSLVSDQSKTAIEQTSASSAPDTSDAAESSTEAKPTAGTAVPDTAAESKNEPALTTPETTSPAQETHKAAVKQRSPMLRKKLCRRRRRNPHPLLRRRNRKQRHLQQKLQCPKHRQTPMHIRLTLNRSAMTA